MTRKQIIKILNDIIEPMPLKTKEAIADAIIALPIDVPGDEEIHKMAYNACMKPSMPNGEPEPEHGYYDAYVNGSNDMRSEILKRNRP